MSGIFQRTSLDKIMEKVYYHSLIFFQPILKDGIIGIAIRRSNVLMGAPL